MMKRTLRLMTAVAAFSLVLAAPLAAQAQESDEAAEERHSIEEVKERALAAIDRRLHTLENLTSRVSDAAHVSDEHEAALLADYRAATEGLEELGTEIAGATTPEELRRLVPLIATGYRVYLVIVPKSAEVAASDRVGAVVERMDRIANRLSEAIDRADDAGFDVTDARRWLISARDEIAEASRTGVPVADDLIDLDASDWEEPAKSMLQEGKRRLENARVDVHQAHGSLMKALDALKEAIG
jgi:hypothetical protein